MEIEIVELTSIRLLYYSSVEERTSSCEYLLGNPTENSRGMLPSLREVSCLDGDGVGVVTRTKLLSDSDDSDLNTTISPKGLLLCQFKSIPFN